MAARAQGTLLSLRQNLRPRPSVNRIRSRTGKETKMNANPKGIALIMDASSGTGVVYADRLAKRAYDLISRGSVVTV